MKNKKNILVIGAGFSGMASAAVLAQKGYSVQLIEKNDQLGGRCRLWEEMGFSFDMGPSWYWMPEVFENFFHQFGYTTEDFYDLKRLDPGYRVYFSAQDFMDIPADPLKLEALFEEYEPGAGLKLREFLTQAEYKYKVGMRDYVFRPSHSILEFLDPTLLLEAIKIQIFSSQRSHVRKYFKHPYLISILEFPVLFLGGTAQNIPALYSMMNYADLSLGTWFPMGGMVQIPQAMGRICKEQNVEIHLNTEVHKILSKDKLAREVHTNQGIFYPDYIISGADYEHTDQELLEPNFRNYSPAYWDSRTLSPSSLLFYLGINRKLEGVKHHTLFFDESLDDHAHEIYKDPKWPSKPLFYVCCTSVTDPSTAPEGMENLFLLMPLAPGLQDSEELREKYYEIMMDRMEKTFGQEIKNHVIVKRSYAMHDFIQDYHSYKGNAYGLANTLFQTAFLKPKMKSKKLKNLLFTGQLTVPGPGVPPSIISGEIAAKELLVLIEKQA